MPKKIAHDWYEVIAFDNAISLIREIHVARWLRCNIWHIKGAQHDLLIDTGMGLRPLKREVSLLRDKPLITLSTHCHFDHMGGAHQFACRLGHRLEADAHISPTPANSGRFDRFVRTETFSALPYAGFRPEHFKITPAPLTAYLDDGDVVDLGNRCFTVFHLPGHSPGSIALYEKRTRTLFSGDVIYAGALYDSLEHSDKSLYRDSLRRLREMPVEVIHGGHYESFGKQRMNEIIDDYLAGGSALGDDRVWIEQQIRLARQK